MLEEEPSSIIQWTEDGKAFVLGNRLSDLLPKFFRHDRVASFHRQLNL